MSLTSYRAAPPRVTLSERPSQTSTAPSFDLRNLRKQSGRSLAVSKRASRGLYSTKAADGNPAWSANLGPPSLSLSNASHLVLAAAWVAAPCASAAWFELLMDRLFRGGWRRPGGLRVEALAGADEVDVAGVNEQPQALAEYEYRVDPVYGVSQQQGAAGQAEVPERLRHDRAPGTLTGEPLHEEPHGKQQLRRKPDGKPYLIGSRGFIPPSGELGGRL